MRKILMIGALVFLCAGCASSMHFSKTGNVADHNYEANSNCDVKIYTAPPQIHYEEIGVIEFGDDFWSGKMGGPSSIDEIRKKATETVCKNGGNGLIVWESTSFGTYKKATVIKITN